VGAAAVAKDKGYASYFMQKQNYNVPIGQTFFSEKLNARLEKKRGLEEGLAYAKQLGFPVIVKPNDRSQGAMVAKVRNETAYYEAARMIFKTNNVMLVQEFCIGRDYRVVVLDDKVIAAYERIPLQIKGDGKSDIHTLLVQKKALMEAQGRYIHLEYTDFRILEKLNSHNLSFESILPLNEKLALLDNANLSAGGDSEDFTEEIHQDFKELAINVSRDMGLRLCGVDIMTADICKPMNEQKYTIIEINAYPGLDNYASIGEKQKQRVMDFYLELLKKMEEM
jgi:D-alanine-D-alanine ligase-like ATP-grasp enzyme